MLKIGVLGAGHLGKIHIRCIRLIAEYELVGFYDPDPATAEKVEKEFGIRSFPDIASLVDAVEVVDIVTPTIAHFPVHQRPFKNAGMFLSKNPLLPPPPKPAHSSAWPPRQA